MSDGYKNYVFRVGIFLSIAIIFLGAFGMFQAAKSGGYESIRIFLVDLFNLLLLLAVLLSALAAAYFLNKHSTEHDRKEKELEESQRNLKKRKD